MVSIDKTKTNLLSMKRKILEVSKDVTQKDINDYEKIVADIDKEMYKNLTKRIKNSNYNNQSIEEKLKLLLSFEEEYQELEQFQKKHKKVYSKRVGKELELSNINNIKIDQIRKIINAISDYLKSNENINKDKNELETLNTLLIEETKKSNMLEEKLKTHEKELLNKLLNSKGRIYDENGEVEYTSIKEEGKKFNVDIEELINNQSLLNEELDKADKATKETQENLKVATICHNKTSNVDYDDVFQKIKNEELQAKYKLNFLQIINEIAKKIKNQDAFISKRRAILELIKERSKILKEINISYLYDPFVNDIQVKIKNQIEVINSIGDNTEKIKSIRKRIAEIIDNDEQKDIKNTNLLAIINKEYDLFYDDMSFANIKNSNSEPKKAKKNQVIAIKSASNNILNKNVFDKTSGVIKRVMEMITGESIDINDDNNYEQTPQIVVEASENNEYINNESNINNTVINDINEVQNTDEQPQETSVNSKTFNDEQSENIFHDETPFNETPLFVNRYDDGETSTVIDPVLSQLKMPNNNNQVEQIENKNITFNNYPDDKTETTNVINNENDMTMPDLFWPESSEPASTNEETPNIDKQVEEHLK